MQVCCHKLCSTFNSCQVQASENNLRTNKCRVSCTVEGFKSILMRSSFPPPVMLTWFSPNVHSVCQHSCPHVLACRNCTLWSIGMFFFDTLVTSSMVVRRRSRVYVWTTSWPTSASLRVPDSNGVGSARSMSFRFLPSHQLDVVYIHRHEQWRFSTDVTTSM